MISYLIEDQQLQPLTFICQVIRWKNIKKNSLSQQFEVS